MKGRGFGDGAPHSFRGGSEDEFGPEESKECAALKAHAIWHREDQLVAFRGSNKGEGYTGVS